MWSFLSGLTPASAVFLGLIPVGVLGLVLAFAPANAAYFDRRPELGSARDRALVEAVRAKSAPRQLAVAAAALLMLLTSSAPEATQ
jgi:hypothetical protein